MFRILNHCRTRASLGRRPFVALAACSVGALVASAEEVEISVCPAAVQATIRQNLHGGEIDEIERIRIEGHALYLVEVDIEGFRDLELHISGSGTLRKSVEDIRRGELPHAVREAVNRYRDAFGRLDDVEKVVSDGTTRYHVEFDRRRRPDRKLVFAPDGTLVGSK